MTSDTLKSDKVITLSLMATQFPDQRGIILIQCCKTTTDFVSPHFNCLLHERLGLSQE